MIMMIGFAVGSYFWHHRTVGIITAGIRIIITACSRTMENSDIFYRRKKIPIFFAAIKKCVPGTESGMTGRRHVIISALIHGKVRTDLFQIVDTRAAVTGCPCRVEGRKQDCRQNGDYRNYNEKFDKGKGVCLYPRYLG